MPNKDPFKCPLCEVPLDRKSNESLSCPRCGDKWTKEEWNQIRK